MSTSFYSEEELLSLGLGSLGKNVYISRKTSIYGAENIHIGSNVRIDDFCVLSGNIKIGNYVHIAVYNAIFGGGAGVILNDFVVLSSKCTIYAQSDDYSGEYLISPMVPSEFTNVVSESVVLNKHVLCGTGVTILPGVVIGEGTAVGSMSLVNKQLEEWGIYAGIPCKYKKERKKDLLQLEKQLLDRIAEEVTINE